MSSRSWVIGNSPQCDICVEGRTVSGKHCRLTERGESFLLEDLQSTNGTFVAGERIDGPRIVRRGDSVTLGRNTPLPWPAQAASITIGRRADNDVVIPLDAVSGEHARLEREGSRVFLVDLGSTNGTAINDPTNKIKRAVLKPTDAVFLGTHRVSAADLLAALPEISTEATTLERERPAELAQRPAAPPDESAAVASPLAGNSPAAWGVGLGISVLCASLLVAGFRSCRQPELATSDAVSSEHTSEERASGPGTPKTEAPTTSPTATSNHIEPDEALVRKSADGLFMVGLRTEQNLALSDASAWACGAHSVICPTAIVNMMEEVRKEATGHNEAIVVCDPKTTLAIVEHKAGSGPAEGFSLAQVEAPLAVVCPVAAGKDVPACIPGQPLAMLSAWADDHKSSAVVRKFTRLTIDRIDRDSQHVATMYKCRCDAQVDEVAGAPVFDASGNVVGCALRSAPTTHEVHVVPIARLSSLLESAK